MIRFPRLARQFRRLAIIYGVMLFIWLSAEDVSVQPVTLLGWGLAFLILLLMTWGKLDGLTLNGRAILVFAVLMGSVAGLGASVATTALMFFKNAWHAHIFPDFPTGMLLATLERAPVWAAAGGFIGLSFGLGCLALYEKAG